MTGLNSASEGTRVLCLTHLVGEANERPRSWGAAPPKWSHALHGAVLAAVSSLGSSEGSQALVGVPGQQASLPRAVLESHLLGVLGDLQDQPAEPACVTSDALAVEPPRLVWGGGRGGPCRHCEAQG